MNYTPPIQDMLFNLIHVAGLPDLEQAAELDADTIEAILSEAGKLASDVLAPLNWSGDTAGVDVKDGALKMPEGFKDAYTQYFEAGWNAVPFDPEYGGQGLPWGLAFAIQEMWQAANMSFGLCPLLNQGAVDAILHHGSEAQKQTYLPKLIEGSWTGTMNLTEPQAGSDLSAVRAKAEPAGEGTYKIFGQKIYITYGEHDLAENIIHLVLARLPDAPEGTKGISLFLVPKFMVNDDGSLGNRNDVTCVSTEHKLGIHASPTCTMSFGDNGGATGYLIGQENEGLKCMFTMMNNARLSVGLQGVAIADRAYQHALNYARERVQGFGFADRGNRVAIIEHADVKRMLLSMRALTEAGRTMAYEAGVALDKAGNGDVQAKALVELMTPIVKSWCTDMSVEVASIGIQVHGGMGFVEETGAAQYYRDARILPIYEGTNGIQAADLVFRKVLRDGGQTAKAYIENLRAPVYEDLHGYLECLEKATDKIVNLGGDKRMDSIAAISTPYLNAFGYVMGGAMLLKSVSELDKAQGYAPEFTETKKHVTKFYTENILPRAQGFLKPIFADSELIENFSAERF